MSTVRVGKPVPAFETATTADIIISNESLKGNIVVLYFYPKDNTPGCTAEGCDFRDHHEDFRDLGAVVLGVSRDSRTSHEKFREKCGFPFDLLSDENEILCRLFDVIREKNLYGRKVPGIERSTFLIDCHGVLRREWRKVRVPGHVEEVLAAVRAL